jgi:hypothetical protein
LGLKGSIVIVSSTIARKSRTAFLGLGAIVLAAIAVFYGVDENLCRYTLWIAATIGFRAGKCGTFPPELKRS